MIKNCAIIPSNSSFKGIEVTKKIFDKDFTIMLWAKNSNTFGRDNCLVELDEDVSINIRGSLVTFSIERVGYSLGRLNGGGKEWTHIGMSYNKQINRMMIYVGGKELYSIKVSNRETMDKYLVGSKRNVTNYGGFYIADYRHYDRVLYEDDFEEKMKISGEKDMYSLLTSITFSDLTPESTSLHGGREGEEDYKILGGKNVIRSSTDTPYPNNHKYLLLKDGKYYSVNHLDTDNKTMLPMETLDWTKSFDDINKLNVRLGQTEPTSLPFVQLERFQIIDKVEPYVYVKGYRNSNEIISTKDYYNIKSIKPKLLGVTDSNYLFFKRKEEIFWSAPSIKSINEASTIEKVPNIKVPENKKWEDFTEQEVLDWNATREYMKNPNLEFDNIMYDEEGNIFKDLEFRLCVNLPNTSSEYKTTYVQGSKIGQGYKLVDDIDINIQNKQFIVINSKENTYKNLKVNIVY